MKDGTFIILNLSFCELLRFVQVEEEPKIVCPEKAIKLNYKDGHVRIIAVERLGIDNLV
jgi:hypothetical protein